VARATRLTVAAVWPLVLWLPFFGSSTSSRRGGCAGTRRFDLAYGAITGLLVPAAFLAAFRLPGTGAQAAAGALAYVLAGLAGQDYRYFLLAAFVVAGALAIGVRGTIAPRPLLVVLATGAAAPFTIYALRMAANERHGLPPHGAHFGLHAWAGVAAMGFGIPLVALLAAVRPEGRRVAAWSASGAAVVWGLGCILNPHKVGSECAAWGAAALAWAAAFAFVSLRGGRR
jgi:hypothetical protein